MTTCTAPGCTNMNVLFYPEPRCYRHTSAEQRAFVDGLEKRARKTLNSKGWPYGPNISIPGREYLLNWAEGYGLKLAGPRHGCMHWLRKGRCNVSGCWSESKPCWMDHVTYWTRDGKPALLLAQPYGLDPAELVELVADDSLHVRVSTCWYGHGTVSVEVWRQDAYDRYLADGRAPAR